MSRRISSKEAADEQNQELHVIVRVHSKPSWKEFLCYTPDLT